MYINGKYNQNETPISVIDFVRGYKLNKNVVFIAINEKAIKKSDYETTMIHDDDRVEFVFTVSGG